MKLTSIFAALLAVPSMVLNPLITHRTTPADTALLIGNESVSWFGTMVPIC
jgi:hypothetical protein